MKKFNFSLEKVLEVKEQILENLKIELGNLNNNLINLNTAIENLKGQFKDLEKEFNEKSSTSISVGEMLYYKMLINNVLKQIEISEEQKQMLLKKIEVKRQEVVNMKMEISSLEKLKEKELVKYTKSVTRNEELFIEEFISNKGLSKKYAI